MFLAFINTLCRELIEQHDMITQQFDEMAKQMESYDEKCTILQKDRLLIEDKLKKMQVVL